MCKENNIEQNMPLENAVDENDAEFEVILFFFSTETQLLL